MYFYLTKGREKVTHPRNVFLLEIPQLAALGTGSGVDRARPSAYPPQPRHRLCQFPEKLEQIELCQPSAHAEKAQHLTYPNRTMCHDIPHSAITIVEHYRLMGPSYLQSALHS